MRSWAALALASGVAIPHARIPELNRPVAAFFRLESPVAFDAADGMPVDMVFGLLSPEQAGAAHLHALAAISRMMRDEALHVALGEAREPRRFTRCSPMASIATRPDLRACARRLNDGRAASRSP